jgi:hypothetical protein
MPNFVSPGAMAGNAIEQFLMQRQQEAMQQQEAEFRRQQAEEQSARQQQQLMLQAEQQRADEAFRQSQLKRQGEQDEIAATGRRQDVNAAGVRGMIGEAISQPLTPDSARTISGMAYGEGLPVPGIVDQALAPPKAPSQFTLGEGDVRFDETGNVVAQGPAKRVAPSEGPKQPYQWVLRNGEETYTNSVLPGDKQLSGRQTRPITGAERKTLGFFQRMLEAERNARAVEGQVGNRDFAAEYAPGAALENFLKSEAGQKYTQAQRTFTEGRLRKESGAAIPQGEYDTDRDTNFKRPGDKDESVAQKRASRLKLLRGAANESGRALQEFFGDDATIDSLLSEFTDKQPPGTGGGPAVGTRRTISGQLAEWDGRGWLPVKK